jgi:hypothetical protein
VKKRMDSFRRLKSIFSLMFLLVSSSLPWLTSAQEVPYARTFAKSNEEVDAALKEMQAYTGQKLPIVDGFVANADQPLNRYESAFYQFAIELMPAASGGTVVRITAKITAWYADRDPSKSGYQALPSSGRLELDLLDRLTEEFSNKPAASISNSGVQVPKPKLDLSCGLPGSVVPSSKASSPTAPQLSGTEPDRPDSDEVTALRVEREAEENRMRQLNTEFQGLQEIQRNQAHPLNLVVVKKAGTPVLTRPAVGSHALFTAAAEDEFEFLDAEGEWIHVQISGVLRGYIRRSSLDLPESIAVRLKSPNGVAANEKQQPFHVESEETTTFPGDWEALRGKRVKLYTVQPVSQASKETGPTAKLTFAYSLFGKFSRDTAGAAPGVEGVVVIFDSADGGIVGAMLTIVQQIADGSLSQDNFWKQCYLEPPDAFQPTLKPEPSRQRQHASEH